MVTSFSDFCTRTRTYGSSELLGFTNGVDILAIKLLEEAGDALVVAIDTDGREDGLDVTSSRRGVSANLTEEVGCEVLHFIGCGVLFFFGGIFVSDWSGH